MFTKIQYYPSFANNILITLPLNLIIPISHWPSYLFTATLVLRPVHTIKNLHQHVISVSCFAMILIPMEKTST